MSTVEIKLYDIFRKDLKLDDDRARFLAEVIQETVKAEVSNRHVEYKSQLKEDIFKIEIQLNSKIEQSKTDMIKWMFAFWVGSTITTLGGLLAILKFMKP